MLAHCQILALPWAIILRSVGVLSWRFVPWQTVSHRPRLKGFALPATVQPMKLLSTEEAQGRFKAVCDDALAGEVIRLQFANGALLELTRVPAMAPPLSAQEIKECYKDSDWAVFENHCAAASDE